MLAVGPKDSIGYEVMGRLTPVLEKNSCFLRKFFNISKFSAYIDCVYLDSDCVVSALT